MIIPSSVLGALEAAANRIIENEPDVPAQLAKMHDRIMGVTLGGPNITLYLQVLDGSLVFFSESHRPADVHLSAPIADFVRLATARDQHALFGNASVRVEGDIATAQQFQSLMTALDLDWEEHLAQFIGRRLGQPLGESVAEQWGDLAARQVGLIAGAVGRWAGRSRNTLEQALRDYLQEEVKHVPTRIEVDNFADDVDQLRLAVERLEAKLNRLR